MGRGSAAHCDGRSDLGRTDRTSCTGHAPNTGTRSTGHPGDARVAQWLRCGESGGQVGPQGRLPPSPMVMGRQTGP